MRRLLSAGLVLLPVLFCSSAEAQDVPSGPTATLIPTSILQFPGRADSNSPAVWQLIDGQNQLIVMTSIDGRPSVAFGSDLTSLGEARPVDIEPWPGGGIWMEAVVADADGTLYGYYHNENVVTTCGQDNVKVTPRIGAAVSRDHGVTWQPLGIVLDAPPGTITCTTTNQYFLGGVGDFSVMRDRDSKYLYFFVSQYYKAPSQQGIGVARMTWADRDQPAGKAMVWQARTWIPATRSITSASGTTSLAYRAATPIFAPTEPWHNGNNPVDAFWGPSVHYNTYLKQYVMLLNRAKDEQFGQEGIYISYSPRLDDPRAWSQPVKIFDGGTWYPQVIGLGQNGTDKLAGQTARFFMGGRSDYVILFTR